MQRGLSLLLLGLLSGAVAAQEAPPPDYTRAEVNEAIRYCLATLWELEANTKRFPMQEHGNPPSSEQLENPENLLTSCVLYRLENGDVEVIPLA